MEGSLLRTNQMKTASAYHHLVWSMVHDRVEAFLREHSCEVRSIGFQCDADCRAFANDMVGRLRTRDMHACWPA